MLHVSHTFCLTAAAVWNRHRRCHQVVNVDISGVVIEQMRRMSNLPGQTWEVADCCSMPQYADSSFGSVLDKGTLDAVLCSSHGQADTVDYMNEVHRLLVPGGTFLLISLGQPHARLAALNVQQPPALSPRSAAAGSSVSASPSSPGSSAGSLTLPYLSDTYRAAHAAAAAALAAASGKPASSYSWSWESVKVYLLPKPSLYLASEQSLAGRPSTRSAPHSDKDQPVAWLGPYAPGAELEAVVAEQGLDLAEYFTGFACKKRGGEQQAVCAVPAADVEAPAAAAAPEGPVVEEEAGGNEDVTVVAGAAAVKPVDVA
jgi:ubiquinone/menaquinone biosynthesis C-methylase UbiE